MTFFFAFIRSSFIDTETFTPVCLQIFCGTYPNRTYRFASPTGFCGRLRWGCWLGVQTCFIQIDFFYWWKVSFKFFIKVLYFYCWLVYVIFFGSGFIDPETCAWVWLQIFSGLYPNQAYGFASPAGLWKVVVRVTVFISSIVINTLIGFKWVTRYIQVWFFVVTCWPK